MTTSATVEGLEKPPVPAGDERQLVVGQPFPPLSTQDSHSQVLVDDDHGSPLFQSSVPIEPEAGRTYVHDAELDGAEVLSVAGYARPIRQTA